MLWLQGWSGCTPHPISSPAGLACTVKLLAGLWGAKSAGSAPQGELQVLDGHRGALCNLAAVATSRGSAPAADGHLCLPAACSSGALAHVEHDFVNVELWQMLQISDSKTAAK
jgi:hypothetical protein